MKENRPITDNEYIIGNWHSHSKKYNPRGRNSRVQ
jgi:hypothetical protein